MHPVSLVDYYEVQQIITVATLNKAKTMPTGNSWKMRYLFLDQNGPACKELLLEVLRNPKEKETK